MELRWGMMRLVFDRRRFAAYLGLTGLFTLLGPFGTFQDFDNPTRLLYWIIVNAGVAIFASLSEDSLFAPGVAASLSRLTKVALSAGSGAIGGAVVVSFVELYLRDNIPNPVLVWFSVAVVCFVIISLRRQVWVPEPRRYTRFFKRLPANLGVDLVSLSMSDHYLAVRTATGSTMVHMRFADALDELEGFPGVQTHRSHWAAADHAEDLERDGSRHVLRLSDGTRLPVSKANLEAVRDMLDCNRERQLEAMGQRNSA